jgi:hypothetical protein
LPVLAEHASAWDFFAFETGYAVFGRRDGEVFALQKCPALMPAITASEAEPKKRGILGKRAKGHLSHSAPDLKDAGTTDPESNRPSELQYTWPRTQKAIRPKEQTSRDAKGQVVSGA